MASLILLEKNKETKKQCNPEVLLLIRDLIPSERRIPESLMSPIIELHYDEADQRAPLTDSNSESRRDRNLLPTKATSMADYICSPVKEGEI